MKVNTQVKPTGLESNIKSSATTKKASLKNGLGGISSSTKSTADIQSASRVNVSDKAQLLSKAKELASSDGVDMEKVERLQSLIDSGEYQVNSEAIADKMLDEHLLMPS